MDKINIGNELDDGVLSIIEINPFMDIREDLLKTFKIVPCRINSNDIQNLIKY